MLLCPDSVAALAFVRPEQTGLGFEVLLEDAYIKKHSTIFTGYLDYFERQWVDKKVTAWRGKSGATAPWNCQGACLKGEMKPTSSLEVWHKHLKVKFWINFQGSNQWGVPENSRADSLQAQQQEPTTRLGLTLQYKITIFQGLPKLCLQAP
ncbi:hypothetical protein DSO57_1019053 [Entomophthora muscae]|uniref:Uncharacterized protein n=1 Tax=Entomophthora muscae TaxID=34485 RepID=A0ACC2T481_9FUNG|nr:hypothetical protein DSO57_1019053 [Entomophthora muscae]